HVPHRTPLSEGPSCLENWRPQGLGGSNPSPSVGLTASLRRGLSFLGRFWGGRCRTRGFRLTDCLPRASSFTMGKGSKNKRGGQKKPAAFAASQRNPSAGVRVQARSDTPMNVAGYATACSIVDRGESLDMLWYDDTT